MKKSPIKKILMTKILVKIIKYSMWLVFLFEAFRVTLGYSKNTHITYIIYVTHIIKLIFKAYKKTDKYFFMIFSLYIKTLTGYCQKNNNKESLSKKACETYQNLSEEEKDKKCQYACERYRNLSEEEREKKHQYGREQHKNLLEDEKQRLVEYIKN